MEFARLKPYLTRAVMNACRDIQRARQKAILMKEMPEMSYQPPDGVLADAVERLPGGTASAVAAALHGGVQAG